MRRIILEGLRLRFGAQVPVVERGDGQAVADAGLWIDPAARVVMGTPVTAPSYPNRIQVVADVDFTLSLLEEGGGVDMRTAERIAVWLTRQRFADALTEIERVDNDFRRPPFFWTEVVDVVPDPGDGQGYQTAWRTEITVRAVGVGLGVENDRSHADTGNPVREITLNINDGAETLVVTEG